MIWLAKLQKQKKLTDRGKSLRDNLKRDHHQPRAHAIALISKNTHPDIGVFNSVISSQKNFTFKRYTPEEFLKISEEFTFVILYQPDYNFESILEQTKTKKINTFIIGGTSTEWSFLNANKLYSSHP